MEQWNVTKQTTMCTILWEKHKQIDLFRSNLARSNKQLISDLFDQYWGYRYKNSCGKKFRGQNVFALLIMEIRATAHKISSLIVKTLVHTCLDPSSPPVVAIGSSLHHVTEEFPSLPPAARPKSHTALMPFKPVTPSTKRAPTKSSTCISHLMGCTRVRSQCHHYERQ